MGKVLLIVSIIITAATAALGFINKGRLDTAVQERVDIEAQAQKKVADLQNVANELKAAQNSLATATAEKEQTISQVETVKSELDKTKTELTTLTSQIGTKDAEIARLTAELAAKTGQLATAQVGQPATSTEPSSEVQARLQEQETLITKLQSDLDNSRGQLETLRRADTERRQRQMRNGLEGRVLAVNQAWNFVVLNLGDKNGVVSNAEMLVKRGSQFIGKVRVTSVEPSTAIADIVSNSVPRGMTIQPGDNVIYQALEE